MTTSETLLCEHVVRKNIRVGVVPVCVARIRATGELATYKGQNDLVYPPRSRPGGCRGLAFVQSPSDELNACDGLHHLVLGLSEESLQTCAAPALAAEAHARSAGVGKDRCVSDACRDRQACTSVHLNLDACTDAIHTIRQSFDHARLSSMFKDGALFGPLGARARPTSGRPRQRALGLFNLQAQAE